VKMQGSMEKESRIFMRQTVKVLAKHRYYMHFMAAQSHSSLASKPWLLVRAVLKGSSSTSDKVEQWYKLSNERFFKFRFSWLARGDEYDIEFIGDFEYRPAEKCVIGLAGLTLDYQQSMLIHSSLDQEPRPENKLLCNLKGLTQDYIGYSKSRPMTIIKGMLPAKFEKVCREDWAEQFKDHHLEVGCNSENECVVCNAVALANLLGWEWHRKVLSQHFADLLDTPASVVLALLKHPGVFRHNTQAKNWLFELETSLKGARNGNEPKGACWGPKEITASQGAAVVATALNETAAVLSQDASDQGPLVTVLVPEMSEQLAKSLS